MRTILVKTLGLLTLTATIAVQAAVFTTDFNSGLPANTAVFSGGEPPGPTVAPDGGVGNSGVLKITQALNGQMGSFVINDFNNLEPVTNFVVRYKVYVGGGNPGLPPADGYSLSFGTIPDAAWGEEGAPGVISVCFDTWDNGAAEAPACDIKFNGAVVATRPFQASTRPATTIDYSDVEITLCAEGRVTVKVGSQVLHSRVATGYTPVAGRFGFGARTGGANDNHWIDDLTIEITDPAVSTITGHPSSLTVNEGQPATFSIAVSGVCYSSVQWFRDNAPITGANSLSYTIASATSADNNAQFRAEVVDGGVTNTSTSATLTVVPAPTLIGANSRNNPEGIFVFFSRDMDPTTALNTANYAVDNGVTVNSAAFNTIVATNGPQSVVLLGTSPLTAGTTYTVTVSNVRDTGNNVINPNPSTASFTQAAGPMTICYDFNSGLPAGAQLFANPPPNSTRIDAGILKLTDALNSQSGAFLSPVISTAPVGAFTARFKAQVNSPQANPADGFSFNFGNDLPMGTYGVAEEGQGNGVIISFDNWDSGGGEAPAIDLKWNNAVIASRKIPKHNAARFIDFALSVRADGTMDLFVDGTNVFNNIPSGFRGLSNGRIGLAGRTGGANENHWIDDVCFTVDAGPVTLVSEPVSQTVNENQTVTFSVNATGGSPRYYQWRENGVDITGATAPTYSFVATPSHNNNTYSVFVFNEFSSATSSNATLTVITDTTAPTVLSVSAAPGGTNIAVHFSEPVAAATATDIANYSVDADAVFVTAATLSADGRTVVVSIDEFMPFAPGSSHSISIKDITDRATTPNTLSPNPTVANFTAWYCNTTAGANVLREFYCGPVVMGGNTLAKLTNNYFYPHNPAFVDALPTFFSPQTAPDRNDYGLRLTTYLVPSETGPHTFEIYSDDASLVSLSTDANPANAVVVARENACCAPRVGSTVNLVAGQAYWMQGLMQEGGGGDYFRVQWKTPSGQAGPFVMIPSANLFICVNPDTTTLTFTEQPASATVDQSRKVSFIALASGSAGIVYQWERSDDGGTTWAPITDATNRQYTIANAASPADNNAQFRAVASVLGTGFSATSSAATLTVTPDTTRPTVVGVVGRSNIVDVCFSEGVDNSLMTVSDPFSYQVYINGDLAVPTNAVFRSDGKSVELQLDQSLHNVSGTTFSVRVSSAIADLAGNTVEEDPAAPSFSVAFPGIEMLSVADINSPLPAGNVFTCNNRDFTVTAGGADIWGTSDQGTFVYTTMAGDFDVRVRVDRLDLAAAAGNNNRWSKAGINVRETLAGGGLSGPASKQVWIYPTPTNCALPPTGANGFEFAIRFSTGGGVTDINPARSQVDYFPAWVRVKRAGNVFAGFISRDGYNWTRYGNPRFTSFASSLLVGMATTSHVQGTPTTAEFGDFSSFANTNISVTITQQPQSVTVTAGTTATFSVGVEITGAPATELIYQWQRQPAAGGGFADVPNAVNASYTTGIQTADESGDGYRVLVYASGHPTLTSDTATVTVDPAETVPPTLVSAVRSCLDLSSVRVVFSEPVGAASSQNAANYSITSYDGQTIPVSSAVREAGLSSVVLTTSAPLTNGNIYTLTVNNVRDFSGNTIAANSQRQITLNGVWQASGSQNIVAIEAENYDRNASPVGGTSWTFSTAFAGYSGSGAMDTLPNTGRAINEQNHITQSPRLDFCINFPRSGIYYIWLRAYARSGSDDSLHVGLNGASPDNYNWRATGWPAGSYSWARSSSATPLRVNVPSAGVHTFNVWMREDGTILDKILLTTDSTLTPTGTGPAESSRQNTDPLPPRLTISKTGANSATLSWSSIPAATLQQAPTISGPWSNAADQSNPQTITLPSEGNQFFRAVRP